MIVKVRIEGVQDEAEGDCCPNAVGGTIFPDWKKDRSSPHLGYPHVQSQPDTNWSRSRTYSDCLFDCRERFTVRTGFVVPRPLPQERSCLVVTGSLTYHTVWSRSDRSSTRVMSITRASMSVLPGDREWRADSLTCAPVTLLYCSLLFLTLYDTSCSVGMVYNTIQERGYWGSLLETVKEAVTVNRGK